MKSMKHLMLILTLMAASITAQGQKVWYNPMSGNVPYIGGRAWNSEIGTASYNRLPDRLLPSLSKNVRFLQQHCAGLYVKFTTDAKLITVRLNLHSSTEYIRIQPPLCHSGVDLYGKGTDGRWHWIGNQMQWKWNYNQVDSILINYERLSPPAKTADGTEYLLYLPPYNGLRLLEIGVPSGSKFQFVKPSEERPVVVYGTSIIHGTAASRPGVMITNMVERDLNIPVIDLGFSGSAMMEGAMFAALAEIDARAFVLDPMPNSVSLPSDTITSRAKAGVRKLRTKTDVPILMVESHGMADKVLRPDIEKQYRQADKCFRRAYDELVSEGVKNLFYLPSSGIDMGEDDMVEGTHPNDLGNRKYADAYEKMLRQMLNINSNK